MPLVTAFASAGKRALVGPGDPDFSSSWSSEATLGNAGTFTTFTFVNKFMPGALSKGGPRVRLWIATLPGQPVTFGALEIGQVATSGNVYNYNGGQAAISLGGSSSFIVPGGSLVPTDPVDFVFDPTKANLVAAAASTSQMVRLSGLGSKFNAYYKSGSQAATTLKSSGYTTVGGAIFFMNRLDVAQ